MLTENCALQESVGQCEVALGGGGGGWGAADWRFGAE